MRTWRLFWENMMNLSNYLRKFSVRQKWWNCQEWNAGFMFFTFSSDCVWCWWCTAATVTSPEAAPSMTLSDPLSFILLILRSSREVADNAISLLTTHVPSLKWPYPAAIYGQPSPSWLLFTSCSKGNNKDDSSARTNVCTGTLLSYRAAEEEQCWHRFHRCQWISHKEQEERGQTPAVQLLEKQL